MSDSYPALIELISRLDGKDRKTAETALYCLNKADERDKRLRAENERLQKYYAELTETNAKLLVFERERSKNLRAALKPFAAHIDDIPSYFDEGIVLPISVSVGDIRAAKAALSNEKSDNK